MKSQRRSRSRVLPLLSALLLLFSVLLLAYGYYQGSIVSKLARADELERQQQFAEAQEIYEELAEHLGSSPLIASRFPKEYAAAFVGRLRALYHLKDYDEVIALAETGIQEEVPDLAAVYYWSANSFFLKGINQDAGEDSFSWFNRAEANYRHALEKESQGRWDIRYNYELVRTVLEESEKNRGKKPVKIMRPTEAETVKPDKKVKG